MPAGQAGFHTQPPLTHIKVELMSGPPCTYHIIWALCTYILHTHNNTVLKVDENTYFLDMLGLGTEKVSPLHCI